MELPTPPAEGNHFVDIYQTRPAQRRRFHFQISSGGDTGLGQPRLRSCNSMPRLTIPERGDHWGQKSEGSRFRCARGRSRASPSMMPGGADTRWVRKRRKIVIGFMMIALTEQFSPGGNGEENSTPSPPGAQSRGRSLTIHLYRLNGRLRRRPTYNCPSYVASRRLLLVNRQRRHRQELPVGRPPLARLHSTRAWRRAIPWSL